MSTLQTGFGATGREVTFAIAASNSTPSAKAQADVVCSGTADQTLINSVITTARLLGIGAKIKCRNGQYNLTGSVIIDSSNIDLEGESHVFWGGYVRGWNGSLGTGLEGFAGAKFKAMAQGFNLISIQDFNVPDGGDTRHRAIRIAKLYLYGAGANTGIQGGNYDDDCMIEDVMIHNVQHGVDVTLDSARLINIEVQDVSGDGIRFTGVNSLITGSVIYDIGGSGISILPGGTGTSNINVVNNVIGDCANYQIYLNTCTSCNVTGNTITSGSLGIVTDGGSSHVISSNSFRNTGQTIYNWATIGAAAISIGNTTATTGCNVTGNCMTTSVTNPGYAIQVLNGSSGNTVTGNVINGTWTANGVAGTTIFASSQNTVFENPGDNGVTMGAGPATITTGSYLAWWKADALTLGNATALNNWPDSSGGAWVLAHGARVAPTYNTAQQNGLPGVLFDGATTGLTMAAFGPTTLITNQPWTIFIVCKQTSITNTQCPLETNGNSVFATAGNSINGFAGSSLGKAWTGTNANIATLIFNGASSSVQVNNGAAATGTMGTSPFSPEFNMGFQHGGSNWFNGYIFEMVICKGALSAADCTAITHALGTKWNIAVT